MGDIVDFTARRLKSLQPAELQTKTINELAITAIEFLLQDWEKMAKNNRLNDYFKSSLPNLIDAESKTNYMSDLNAIAMLELNLELFPQIYFPGTIRKEQLGWVVHFFLADERISTPELMTEAYARCFNILLFLKLKRDATAAGLLE